MNAKYRPSSPMITDRARCRGVSGESLCQSCVKHAPGELTPQHIIAPPMHQGKCGYYRGRE
jgi:hypothetical protein